MKKVILFLALAAGPLVVLAACKQDKATAEGTGSGKAGARGGRGDGGGLVYAVDLFKVEAKQVSYIVQAPGTIEAFERVQVTARVSGAVDKVAFTEGQEVKKGDTLVVIDSERYLLAVNSSKAAMQKAEASQKDVESQVTRREGASETHPGLIPGEELATYRTKTLTAKADTAVANEALKISQLNLRDSAVRSPIDGIIQTRTVETGQYVQAGAVMATLLNQNPMLLRFSVEPQDAPRLQPGMTATFTMRETQRTFDAKLTLIAGAADATTHMVAITGTVNAEEHKYWLRPGSFCDVSVDVGATRQVPLIPRFATRATDHGYVSYVVNNEIAEERVITLGMSTKDGWVEVKTGLKDGDMIVVHGAEALSTGAHVRSSRVTSVDAGIVPAPSGMPDTDAPAGSASGRRRSGGGATPVGSGTTTGSIGSARP